VAGIIAAAAGTAGTIAPAGSAVAVLSDSGDVILAIMGLVTSSRIRVTNHRSTWPFDTSGSNRMGFGQGSTYSGHRRLKGTPRTTRVSTSRVRLPGRRTSSILNSSRQPLIRIGLGLSIVFAWSSRWSNVRTISPFSSSIVIWGSMPVNLSESMTVLEAAHTSSYEDENR